MESRNKTFIKWKKNIKMPNRKQEENTNVFSLSADSQQLHTCQWPHDGMTMMTYIRPADNGSVARQGLQQPGLQSTEQRWSRDNIQQPGTLIKVLTTTSPAQCPDPDQRISRLFSWSAETGLLSAQCSLLEDLLSGYSPVMNVCYLHNRDAEKIVQVLVFPTNYLHINVH